MGAGPKERFGRRSFFLPGRFPLSLFLRADTEFLGWSKVGTQSKNGNSTYALGFSVHDLTGDTDPGTIYWRPVKERDAVRALRCRSG